MHTEYILSVVDDRFATQYLIYTYRNSRRRIFVTPNNIYHNIYGPAVEINRSKHDNREQYYYINNLLHRECGPATVDYGPKNTISRIVYMQRGIHHNKYGPALVAFNDDGSIYCTDYYPSGTPLTNSLFIRP